MKKTRFRAWDKEKKQMWVGQFTISAEDGEIFDYEQSARPEWILQQFTGFYDKEGEEIYEGDILRQRLGRDDALEIPEFVYIQVVFDRGCFREHGEYKNSDPDHYFLGETLEEIMEGIIKPEIEIIGNIWENPDIQKKFINSPRKK